MIGLSLIALAIQAQPDPLAGKKAGLAYVSCVKSRARQLEKSKESADAIATATLMRCRAELEAASQEWSDGWEKRVTRIGIRIDDADRDKMRRETSEELRKTGRELAISEVVSKRAGS